MAPNDEAPYPLELDLDRSRHLRIRWTDGADTLLPLEVLRRNCPCATCRAEREAASLNPLRVVPRQQDIRSQVTVQEADLAGTYALRIRWADGHDTGIYDFKLLRELANALN